MELENNQFVSPEIEQKESIKLIKNTKGYNWEIKLLTLNIDELERLNNIMISKFQKEVI
jgi:hypothetical protein